MSDSEFESATEYTSLMDAHVAPVRTEPVADKSSRRRKPRNSQEPRPNTTEDDVSTASLFSLIPNYECGYISPKRPHPY